MHGPSCAGRRGLGQDAASSRKDRPAVTADWSPTHRGHHFTTRPPPNARACRADRTGSTGCADLPFHALGVRSCVGRRGLGLKPVLILDSDDVNQHPEGRGRQHRCATARRGNGRSALEEHGPHVRAGRGPGQGRQRARHGAHMRATKSGWLLTKRGLDDLIGLPLSSCSSTPTCARSGRRRWHVCRRVPGHERAQYEVLKCGGRARAFHRRG